MRPSKLPRREAVVRALIATSAAGVTHNPLTLQQATAAYTMIPTGSISEKRSQLAEAQKVFAQKPEDLYAFGEKAQLEYDVRQLELNRNFARQLSAEVAAGRTAFLQSLRVAVPDMAAAVKFWTRGANALVLSTKLDADGRNITLVGFGPQSLGSDDGAKFALELVETQAGVVEFNADTSVVQYVQLAMPYFRLSQVVAAGGEIESAYGWTAATAPGGLPLRVRIDESRRDPFEFVALRTTDVSKARRYYESLGMKTVGETEARRKVKFGAGSYGIAMVNADATDPDREPGALEMSFGDPALTTGLLLLPPKRRNANLMLGSPPAELRLVGQAPAAAAGALRSPDGLLSNFVETKAFEAGVGDSLPVVHGAASQPVAGGAPSDTARFELM